MKEGAECVGVLRRVGEQPLRLIDGEQEAGRARAVIVDGDASRLRRLIERLADQACGCAGVAPQRLGQRRFVSEAAARKFRPERLGRKQ